MASPRRVGDLEIEQDLPFQEREWTVQRVAWVLLLALLALGLAGLFGTGPLSSATKEAGDGALAVDYQRFIRHDGRTTLTFTLDGSLASAGELELWIAQEYLGDVEVQGISPQPTETRAESDRVVHVFTVPDPGTTLEVRFSLRPQAMGRLTVEAGVPDGPSLGFSQLSYP